MAAKTQPTAEQPPIDADQILDADFSNVEERRGGGRQAHVPPGDYLLQVVDARVVAVKSDPTGTKKQVRWDYQIVDGESGIGGRITDFTGLDKTVTGGLWKLYNTLTDLADAPGAEIPKGAVKVNLASKVGKRLGAFLQDDDPYEFEGRDGQTRVIEKSIISTTYHASKFISPNKPPVVTPQQAAQQPAAAPQPVQNGQTPVEVAQAIVTPSDDDKDIQPLPVAEI